MILLPCFLEDAHAQGRMGSDTPRICNRRQKEPNQAQPVPGILDPENEVTLKYFSTGVLCRRCLDFLAAPPYACCAPIFELHILSCSSSIILLKIINKRQGYIKDGPHTLKDLIAAYNGNSMLSHVDVIHNRLKPDDLQGDSLLGPTSLGIPLGRPRNLLTAEKLISRLRGLQSPQVKNYT
jgi:hypothetical protein